MCVDFLGMYKALAQFFVHYYNFNQNIFTIGWVTNLLTNQNSENLIKQSEFVVFYAKKEEVVGP